MLEPRPVHGCGRHNVHVKGPVPSCTLAKQKKDAEPGQHGQAQLMTGSTLGVCGRLHANIIC